MNWFWRKLFWSYYTYCCPGKRSWNLNDWVIMRRNHRIFFKHSQRQTCYNLFSAFLAILLYDHPDCVSKPHLLISAFWFFSYPPFPPCLWYYWGLFSIALSSQGGLSFPLLSQNGHILYSVSFSVSWFCLAIFVIDFSALLFFYIHYSRPLKVPMIKRWGESSASKSKYFVYPFYTLSCFYLIFKVQCRNSYQWSNFCIRPLKRFLKR